MTTSAAHRERILHDQRNRPPIIVNPEAIPEAFTSKAHFLGWRWSQRGGKWDKPPVRSDGNGSASSTDPQTWVPFHKAVEGYEQRGLGIGFALQDSGITCIDKDGCRNPETGEIDAWAASLIELAQTYTEVSPSLTGVKMFFIGKLPDWASHKYERDDGSALETWDSGRYVTLTGQRVHGTPADVRADQTTLELILQIAKSWNEQKPAGNLAKHQIDASQGPANFADPSAADDRETVRAALPVLNPDMGYADWLAAGMAMNSVDPSESMLAEWEQWSARGSKFVEGECRRKWASFSTGGKSIGIGTLCRMADATGADWRPKRTAKTGDACRQKLPETRGKSTSVSVDKVQQQKFTPFPVELLPEPIKGFVTAGALSVGCDPAAIAIACLVAAASAVGNSRVVRLKNDWFEPSILWAALVARSGDRKSPAIALALQALRERQKRALKEYDRRHEEWLSAEMAQYEVDLAAWKKSKNSDKGSPPEKPVEPIPWRVMVDDCTIEALGALLAKQPRGLLLACDELSSWLSSFQRYKSGGGSDAPKWLEVHGGRMLLIDRKGGDKKTLCIPRAAVSIVGTIQPSILRAALTPEHRGSGMAARLFLAMPPSRPRQWSEHEIPDYISQAVSDLFDSLLALEMLPGEHIDDDPRPAVVHLSPEAKELFIAFVNEHGIEQADMPGDMAAVWSKLEGGAARIALVLHLVRCATREMPPYKANYVDAASMAAGIKLARWFGREAQRVESLFAETDEEREARELVEWIEKRGGAVTARELQRTHRRYSASTEIAESALAQLAKAGIGKTVVTPTAGRPRIEFVLSPSVIVDSDTSQKTPGKTQLLSTAEPELKGDR